MPEWDWMIGQGWLFAKPQKIGALMKLISPRKN